MTDWEPMARELLWARLLDKTDRVNDLATVLAVSLRDGEEMSTDDVRRMKAALDDMERSVDEYAEPLAEGSRHREGISSCGGDGRYRL